MSTQPVIEIAAKPSDQSQLGALDLGSNSFHLLVAKSQDGRVQVIDKHKEMVRLAAGITAENRLSEAAQERALECLERFAQRLRPLDPNNVRVVGTNTLRKANSPEFLAQAESILGHKINIISGREEARLIYLGVCHDLGITDKRRLIVDIGGGSTEIVSGKRLQPDVLESLYMGCVSMTHKHFSDGQISASRMAAAVTDARLELEPVATEFSHAGWDAALGTSGTINAMREVIHKLYDSPCITLEHIDDLVSQLCTFKTLDSIQLTGLAEERKVVFPGGVAILKAVFEALGIERMETSQGALREGLIVDLIGRQDAFDTRAETVAQLMKRFNVDGAQARCIRETSISLLSQLAQVWDLTSATHKDMLSWAADLMEVGMDISHSGYHKHGSYLLEHMDMPGFSRDEQRQIATLVRCHRRKIPTELFTAADQALKYLTVILRIATVLHRNRNHESPPHVSAQGTANGLALKLSSTWLARHPLTALDLQSEQYYLKNLGIELTVDGY